jgi:ribokinase
LSDLGFRAPRIAVVGSYATGLTIKVKRLPRSGETLLGSGYRVDFGGKGSNQAVGCARLGAQVQFIAQVGKDAFGDMAVALHRDEGIDVTHMKQLASARTGVGFIVVEADSGENCIVLDPGANELLTAADVEQAQVPLQSAAVVLTQLEIPVEAAQAALARGRSAGAVTILNPAPVRSLLPAMLGMIDVLTPNETETKVLAGCEPDSLVEPEVVARELVRRGVKQVVMTLGEKGALLVTSSACLHFPAIPVNPIDTTGAGDAFNAGLATALARQASMETAVQFAVVIGAMAVTKEGVIPSLPRRDEVLQFYGQRNMLPPRWLSTEEEDGRRA